MQLAVRPVPTGRGPRAGAVRANPFVVAGAAAMGAGLIVANGATPVLPDVQVRAMQLTADASVLLDNPLGGWIDTLGTAFDNIEQLGGSIIGGGFPLLSQLGDNLVGSADLIGTSLGDSLEGIIGVFTGNPPGIGLVNLVPAVLEALQDGDVFEVVKLINWDLLFNMNHIFQPLFNHTIRGTGEFVAGAAGLPAMMLRDLANVADVFADFNFWKGLAKSVMEPGLGFAFQFAESAGGIGEALAGGDVGGALNGVVDLPNQLVNALLNGYVVPGETSPWAGILANGGILDRLLVDIPEKIATALGWEAGGGASLEGLFNVDLLGGLTLPFDGLFDTSALTDLLSGFGGFADMLNPMWLIDLVTSMFVL